MLLHALLSGLACVWVVYAVPPAQAQPMQLAWETPVHTDGTPFSGLAGYRLYYGSHSGQYQTMVPVGLATTYTVTNLSAGQTYYFAIKAYNTAGLESTFSNEVRATLPPRPPPPPAQAQPMQLAWETPVHTDGTPFSGLAGYRLYYGSHSGQYQTMVPVGLATTYTVTNLSAGQTYYFAIKAYNTAGLESTFSNEVRGTLRPDPSTAAPAPTPMAQLATPPRPTSSALAAPMTTGPSLTRQTSATPAPETSTRQPSAHTVSPTGALETSTAPLPTTTAHQHTHWEMTLTSTTTYANPFTDVTVRVHYTKAGAPPLMGAGFWDGSATFKVRQVFPEAGTWSYTTTATDVSNHGLHNRAGEVHVLPYTGTNGLYRHGLLQVSPDHRFFAHADGTPFLWVADTLWGATVWLTEAGFREAVADRRAKHFTVLQTNFAHQNAMDTAGETPWQGDRWNVHFMQKLDRMFSDANDQGMYLFVNGLRELRWDRGLVPYERLVEMIGARYAGHYVSFGAGLDDPSDPVHAQIQVAIRRTAPRTLVVQPPGVATEGQGAIWMAHDEDDTPLGDSTLEATGADGTLALAYRHAIDASVRWYHHVPPQPMVHAVPWYEGHAGVTAEISTQLGYLCFLSGHAGYTYGTSLWDATDADLPAWKAFRGTTYMQYMYDFFVALDGGRPLRPRHALIQNQATREEARMVVGVSTDGLTYAAFLPQGGTIRLDLTALVGTTIGVTWYNPFTGQYHDQGIALGGAVHAFDSPFGATPSALVVMAHGP